MYIHIGPSILMRTPRKRTGEQESQTPSLPENLAAPIIIGSSIVGNTLSVTAGLWTGRPTPTVAYQWLRDANPISGAIGANYLLTSEDADCVIAIRVTATNSQGSAEETVSAGVILDIPVNDSMPYISGVATLDSVLTANPGIWRRSPTLSYQWQRNASNIADANSAVYTCVVADVSNPLRVAVTATNAAGSVSVTTDPTDNVTRIPSNTSVPTISGTALVGQTLTTSNGTWAAYPTPTYSYQWSRNGTNIAGASSFTYALVAADRGQQVTCRVTATNVQGSTDALSSNFGPINDAPVNTAIPAITGNIAVGEVLTSSNGTWTGYPTPSYTRQWLRNGANISGATATTYTLIAADAGQIISVLVTGTNSQGNSSATSANAGPITSVPINTILPVVTGDLLEGETLTATTGTWTGYPTPTYTYQWLREDSNISGATSNSYILTSEDVDENISIRVTATNSTGSNSATSASVGPIEGLPSTDLTELVLSYGGIVFDWRNESTNSISSPTTTYTPTWAGSNDNTWEEGVGWTVPPDGKSMEILGSRPHRFPNYVAYRWTKFDETNAGGFIFHTGPGWPEGAIWYNSQHWERGLSVGFYDLAALDISPNQIQDVTDQYLTGSGTTYTIELTLNDTETTLTIDGILVATVENPGVNVTGTWSGAGNLLLPGQHGNMSSTDIYHRAVIMYTEPNSSQRSNIRDWLEQSFSLTEQVQLALFSNSEPGGMWDFTDPSTLRQMHNGTGAVADGDPIGWAQDLSGNGNHLVQATALKRPGFGWEGAVFDGVDDALVSIKLFDLTAGNEAVACIGMNRANPEQSSALFEMSTNSGLNTGVLALFSGFGTGIYDRFRSCGTSGGTLVGFAASGPNQAVICYAAKISPPMRIGRRNGVVGVNNTSSQGSGNYGSYQLHVGARAQSSLFFSGSIARLLICGRLLSPEETALVEAWCDEPLGVLP